MENASKALIYAGEILVGVLLLTLMVFLFQSLGAFSDTVDKNIETKNINEFNAPLEKYRERKDITAHDIITMGNYAKQYNEKMQSERLKVIVQGVESKFINAHKFNEEQKQYEFIEKYSTKLENAQTGERKIIYFECTQMTYDEETGRINEIRLKIL